MKLFMLILPMLFVSAVASAKSLSIKDVKIDAPKMSDGAIELESFKHLTGINAIQMTLKTSRTKDDGTSTYYFCTVKDAEGNILKEIDTFGLPKEKGTKERRQIPLSDLPPDLKAPITIVFKARYVCANELCQEVK